MPEYILNGEPIEVAPEHVEIFKLQNPDSELANGSYEKIARDIPPTIGKANRLPDRDPSDGGKRYGVQFGRWFFGVTAGDNERCGCARKTSYK